MGPQERDEAKNLKVSRWLELIRLIQLRGMNVSFYSADSFADVLMGAQSQAVPSSSAAVARPGRQVGRKSLRRFSVQEMAPIMTRRPDEARYVTSVVTLPPLECLSP